MGQCTTPEAPNRPGNRPPCLCGCGQPVVSFRARYLTGHNSKLMVRTEQHKERIRQSNLRRFAKDREAGEKRCPGCGLVKAFSEFRPRGRSVRSRCRECDRVDSTKYRAENPERAKASQLKARLFVEHGIRQDDYQRLFEAQGGACAICGSPDPGARKSRLMVDHCHKTNEIRGLLCDRCNRALGFLKEDPAVIRKALDYVETSRTGLFSVSRRKKS